MEHCDKFPFTSRLPRVVGMLYSALHDPAHFVLQSQGSSCRFPRRENRISASLSSSQEETERDQWTAALVVILHVLNLQRKRFDLTFLLHQFQSDGCPTQHKLCSPPELLLLMI
jgi:hypothetical protein